jgi:hypothetical protein
MNLNYLIMDRLISFKVVLFFFLLISVSIRAQVGIGTDTPQRALEVSAAVGTPPMRFTNLKSTSTNIASSNIKSVVVDENGDVGVGRPLGSLLATIVSSRNSDFTIGLDAAPSTITFDTDDLAATGTISRSGGDFTILTGGSGLYTFALQPQITTNTPAGYVTFWAVKNGVNIPNSGVRTSSTGDDDTMVIPLILTLDLIVGDVISFKASCTVSNKYFFDFTAASGLLPGIPAVIIDVKGYHVL